MHSSLIFLERSRISGYNVLHSLTFLRHAGGPRTFPGGLNKWQWKRLHEKQAREKEKRLLDQEKQLYQARVRSEIRSKISNSDPSVHDQNVNSPNYKPLSPKDHIKALADRFMKEGAEDLWNEADGPISSPSKQQLARIESNHNPIDLRRVISGQNSQISQISSGVGYNKWNTRHYSVYLYPDNRYKLLNARHYSVRTTRFSYRKNDSSSSEDDGTDADEGFLVKKSKDGIARGSRLSLVGSLDGEGSDDDGDRKKKKKKTVMMSSAALGKYDIKKTKRIPLENLEDEDDFSLHVQAIRNELNKRRMAEKDMGTGDDDSILSPKRFDECNISPLTIKALTLAGYVQMTKVQHATISVYLEGKDALVKAKTGTGKSAAFLF